MHAQASTRSLEMPSAIAMLAFAAVLSLSYAATFATPAVADLGDCGQPVSTGSAATAVDALFTLRVAVGLGTCDLRVCDVDATCTITAGDAVRILARAVNLPQELDCHGPCQPTTTTTSVPITTTTTSTTTLPITTTTTTTTSSTTTTIAGATWTDVLAIFAAAGCATEGCHGPEAQPRTPSNLQDFDAGYPTLVNAPVECPESAFEFRVVPGDPDNSFLLAKVLGTQDCRSQMPLGGEMLTPDQIETIRSWIAAGALKN